MLRTLGRVLAFTAALLLATATVASAAAKPKPPNSAPTTTVPSPTALHASLRLYLFDAFYVHRRPVTVPGRTVHVDGVVRPYVAGQWVTIKSFLGRRLIKTDRLRIKPSRRHNYGRFTERLKSSGAGKVSVQVTHGRSAQLLGFRSRRSFAVLGEQVGFGSTGAFVDLIQQRLAALHFWIPQTGVYDSGTGLAVDAYHRLLRAGTSQALDGRTISSLLNGRGQFKVRFPHQGRHAEANLGLQLLALIDGSKVQYIFPISSGKPSTPTILGSFRIYSRVRGYLPDGMYYSSFFIRGYAIHGYNPAPDYPASHGCMRLPIQDAIPAFNWLTYHDWVDTYD